MSLEISQDEVSTPMLADLSASSNDLPEDIAVVVNASPEVVARLCNQAPKSESKHLSFFVSGVTEEVNLCRG